MSELKKNLDCIKIEKGNERSRRLKKECSDGNILNDAKLNEALDIAKHESTITLPGVALFTAMVALILSFSNIPLALGFNKYCPLVIPLIFIGAMIYIIYLMICVYDPWKEVYYDLIEIRTKERRETEPTVLSKLDKIISKVNEIDVLEKKISSKIEDIENEVKTIKKK
jgi:hypothetical protein